MAIFFPPAAGAAIFFPLPWGEGKGEGRSPGGAFIASRALMLARHRSFAVYFVAALVALIFLSASGVGDWGVAHGQTAPGRHPGARAAEATPGPPGAGDATGTDRLAGMLPSPTISATSLVGFILTAAGLGLIVVGAARHYKRRQTRSRAPALSSQPSSEDAIDRD